MRSTDLPEAFEHVLKHAGLADLGPGPRMDVLSPQEINHTLERIRTPQDVSELIRALLLLWNDHHDQAHALVQERETPDGNLIHAILHRREPDYGNARYWFHRVGDHACFDELTRQVGLFLSAEQHQPSLLPLLENGRWTPDAFISACQRAGSQRNPVAERVSLQKIQEIETRVLLRHLMLSEM